VVDFGRRPPSANVWKKVGGLEFIEVILPSDNLGSIEKNWF